MTQTAPLLVPLQKDDHWIVSYCIHINPGDPTPVFTHASISRADESGPETVWRDVTEQTFHNVAAMPPTAGHQVLPYLVYHLDQIRKWLVVAHEAECLQDTVRYISTDIAAIAHPDLHSVDPNS